MGNLDHEKWKHLTQKEKENQHFPSLLFPLLLAKGLVALHIPTLNNNEG